MTMTDQDMIEWLISEAGPVLKYRTARDLLADCSEEEIAVYRDSVVQDSEVQTWLARLERCAHMHNGTNDRFENIMGRLTDLGLDRSFSELDQRLTRFRAMLADWVVQDRGGMLCTLDTVILAWGLAQAGYTEDEAVLQVTRRRLSDIYHAVRRMDFDIFYPVEAEPKKPKNFIAKRVVRPEYAPNGRFILPYIYDLHLAAAFPTETRAEMLGSESAAHIRQILQYVLDPRYQRFPPGYGILIDDHTGKTKYYAVGWNVDLPGFFQAADQGEAYNPKYSPGEAKALLLRLELMSSFEEGRQSDWFCRSLAYLHSFRQASGTYLLPSDYLCQVKEGYWVMGNHMRLQPGRRRLDRELGSTFRMLLLEKTSKVSKIA